MEPKSFFRALFSFSHQGRTDFRGKVNPKPQFWGRLQFCKSFVVITMDRYHLAGTWSTAFPKSAVRGSKGQPGGPNKSQRRVWMTWRVVPKHCVATVPLKHCCDQTLIGKLEERADVYRGRKVYSWKTGLLSLSCAVVYCVNSRALCHWQCEKGNLCYSETCDLPCPCLASQSEWGQG